MQKIGGKVRRRGTIIFDDLAFKLTPSERIIFGIIHRFSGYALGECRLKPNKIAELAGVSRSTVYNATKHLSDLGMITVVRHQKSNGAFFRALKVIREMLDDSVKMTGEEIERLETKVIDNGRAAFEAAPQFFIESTKTTPEDFKEIARAFNFYGHSFSSLANSLVTTKAEDFDGVDEVYEDLGEQQFGDSAVNALFEFWKQEVGLEIKSRVKANRRAAFNLLKKHGQYAVRQGVQFAAIAKYADYAPVISDYVDLQSKWSLLHLWAQKRAHTKLMERYEELSIEDRVKFKRDNPELANIITQKRRAA